jgi:hypothetical protein
VALGDELEARGVVPEAVLEGHDDNWLIALLAGVARSDAAGNQCLRRDPNDAEPWHGMVLGKKREAVQKVLRRAAIWVVPPEDDGCSEPYPRPSAVHGS